MPEPDLPPTPSELNSRNQHLIAALPDGLLLFKADLQPAMLNAAGERLYRQVFPGGSQSDRQLCSLQDALLQHVFATGEQVMIEYPGTEANRQTFVEARYLPYETTGSQATSVLSIWRDATGRKMVSDAQQAGEHMMRAALGRAGLKIYTQDKDLCYNWVYDQSRGLLDQAYPGKTDEAFYSPEDARGLMALKRQVLDSGAAERRQMDLALSNGDLRTLELVIEPLRDETGAVTGLLCSSLDVTERVRSERELKRLATENQKQHELLAQQHQLEARLNAQTRSILDADPGGLAVLSGEQLEHRFYNRAYRQILPHPEEDPLGRPYTEVWSQAEHQRGSWIMRRVLLNGYPVQLERYAQPFADGSIHYFAINLLRIEWEGQPAVLLSIWDVTELERANMEAERAADEARRLAAELEAVFNAIYDGVTVFDAHGRTVRANPTAIQLMGIDPTGLEREDLHRKINMRHLDGSPVPEEATPSGRALSGERISAERYMIQDAQAAQDHIIVTSASPIYNADSRLLGAVVSFQDITDAERNARRQAALLEEIDRQSSLLHAIIDNANASIFAKDLEGRYILSNRFHAATLNMKPQEVIGLREAELRERIQFYDEYVENDRRVLATNAPIELEEPGIDENGQRRTFLTIKFPLRASDGHVYGVCGIATDISERKRAEEALRLSDQRFRIALGAVPIFVFTMDRELRYTWVFNTQFGFTPEQVLGKRDDELFPPEVAQRSMAMKREVIESGRGIQTEVKEPFEDDYLYFFVNYEPILDDEGQVVGLTGSALDITTQRRLENIKAEYDTQVEVQRRLMEQREMERSQLARDLHDGPLQELTLAGFLLAEAMKMRDESDRVAKLQTLRELISKEARDLRVFCNELRPPALAPFGLERAIRSHVHEFKDHHPHLRIELDLDADKRILPETTRMAFFRVFQEALNNIARHASANQVWVTLRVLPDKVRLEIRDNGVGFSVPTDWRRQARSGHLGLLGMRERAQAVGARMTLESQPGEGTLIALTIARPPAGEIGEKAT